LLVPPVGSWPSLAVGKLWHASTPAAKCAAVAWTKCTNNGDYNNENVDITVVAELWHNSKD